MTTPLLYLRQIYLDKSCQRPIETFNSFPIFQVDALQRIGKQFISILVSKSMIKSQTEATNRSISLALKRFEDDLTVKMKVNSKKDLYAIFGKYTVEQLQLMNDLLLIQIELAQMFFRRLKQFSDQNQSLPKFRPLPYHKFSTLTSNQNSSSDNQSTADSLSRGIIQKNSYKNLWLKTIMEEQPKRSNLDCFANYKSQDTDEGLTDEERSQRGDNNDEESFNFDLTQKDTQTNTRDPCEEFFINIVAYLKNLSSPQGELTYIWQHLKWQGFQTFFEPYLNEMHEWVCVAKIHFPANMITPEKSYLSRTQTSKNKKKSRQLACMDLLKALYLQYPEVWFMYKHLKEEKKLSIAPLEQQKDDDELAIITKRTNYFIDRQKIKKLFNHNKTDIRILMEKISAKAQLNTLLQQLPGRVTSPKIEKRMMQGCWSVPVRIEYRTEDQIENRLHPKVYEKTVICQNAKIAQQQAYMQAIIKLYQQNPQLFEKIQSIKIAKNIRDAEKKLPLLRNLTSDAQIQTNPYNKIIRLI